MLAERALALDAAFEPACRARMQRARGSAAIARGRCGSRSAAATRSGALSAPPRRARRRRCTAGSPGRPRRAGTPARGASPPIAGRRSRCCRSRSSRADADRRAVRARPRGGRPRASCPASGRSASSAPRPPGGTGGPATRPRRGRPAPTGCCAAASAAAAAACGSTCGCGRRGRATRCGRSATWRISRTCSPSRSASRARSPARWRCGSTRRSSRRRGRARRREPRGVRVLAPGHAAACSAGRARRTSRAAPVRAGARARSALRARVGGALALPLQRLELRRVGALGRERARGAPLRAGGAPAGRPRSRDPLHPRARPALPARLGRGGGALRARARAERERRGRARAPRARVRLPRRGASARSTSRARRASSTRSTPDWYLACAAMAHLVGREPAEAIRLLGRAPDAFVDSRAALAAACGHVGRVERRTRARPPLPRAVPRDDRRGAPTLRRGEAVEWLFRMNPLRRAEDREWLAEGLARVGLPAAERFEAAISP